jgi:hypothetical protein
MDGKGGSRVPTDGDRPVFVTPDGRPRRRPRWLARAAVALMAGWLAAIATGAAGFLQMPPLPHAQMRLAAAPARVLAPRHHGRLAVVRHSRPRPRDAERE